MLLPYNPASQAAKALSTNLTEKLGIKVRRILKNGNFRPTKESIVVNYGVSSLEGLSFSPEGFKWINHPNNVQLATNKLRTFEFLQREEVPTPRFTTNREEATGWLKSSKIVCRMTLNGHSGEGIVLVETPDGMVDAPLYTQYRKKDKEFRVHVFNGKVIDVTQKRRLSNSEVNPFIRSHANGWVFCRENIQEPENLRDVALKAINALGLQFGAVDIIWNKQYNRLYVLEVNSAPGLEGTTVINYTNAILETVYGKAEVSGS